MSDEDAGDRIQTITGVLIAVITVLAAMVAWWASVTEDNAGDEDYAGLQCTVRAEQARAVNYVDALEHYGSFLNFRRSKSLSDRLEKAAKKHKAHEERYETASRAAADLAAANLGQFPARFMNRDGTYSLSRDMGAMWQEEAKQQDMDDQAHFVAAEVSYQRTLKLSLAVVVMTLGLVALTLVEVLGGGAQMLWLVVGSVLGFAGLIWAVMLEMGR